LTETQAYLIKLKNWSKEVRSILKEIVEKPEDLNKWLALENEIDNLLETKVDSNQTQLIDVLSSKRLKNIKLII